jgi:hypothetical protein
VTAINGFRKYDIVRLDRDIFSEADFLAAEVTYQREQTEKFLQEEQIQQTIRSFYASP